MSVSIKKKRIKVDKKDCCRHKHPKNLILCCQEKFGK